MVCSRITDPNSDPGQIRLDPQLWRQERLFFHGQEVKGKGQQICHEILIFILAIIELVIYREDISYVIFLAHLNNYYIFKVYFLL